MHHWGVAGEVFLCGHGLAFALVISGFGSETAKGTKDGGHWGEALLILRQG